MTNGLDSIFGVQAEALRVLDRRAEIIASNLANANTPGFKAKELDFRAALFAAVENERAASIERMNPDAADNTINIGDGTALEDFIIYREPAQPAMDANTVDTQAEHAAYLDNALRYQASLTFMGNRVRSLLTAIRGE